MVQHRLFQRPQRRICRRRPSDESRFTVGARQCAAHGSRPARARRQQLESRHRQTHEHRSRRRSHVARRGVQSLQPRAVRAAQHPGDHRRKQHVWAGHHPGQPAPVDAARIQAGFLDRSRETGLPGPTRVGPSSRARRARVAHHRSRASWRASNLAYNVFALRKALGDTAENRQYIESANSNGSMCGAVPRGRCVIYRTGPSAARGIWMA